MLADRETGWVTQSHGTTGVAREKHIKGSERGHDDNAYLQGVAK